MSPRASAALGRTLSSLRESRNFRLYLTGQTISAIGMWMNFTAAAWLVLQLTHSGTALGTQMALYFLPMLVLGAYGGVLADRFDKRRILILTQSAHAVVVMVMFVLVATDVVELWMIYVLAVASGVVTALDNPTRQSFYVEMVGEERVRNAVSLNSAAFTGTRIIGPAVAGLLITTVGMAMCFLIDALSFVAMLIALALMRTGELHAQEKTTRDRGHLVEGLRYVWRTDDLRRPLIAMAIVFTFAFNFAVFVPLLAERTFGGDAGTFGVLSALAGVGSFLGAVTMASRVAEPRLRGLAIWAFATGVAMILPGLAPTLVWAAITMIPMGYTLMAFMITGNTMLQLTSRPEARGRVMALYGIVFLGSTPIGAPIAGVIGEHLGARVGFVLSGLVAAGLGLALLAIGRVRSDRARLGGMTGSRRALRRPSPHGECPGTDGRALDLTRKRPEVPGVGDAAFPFAPAPVSPRGGSRATSARNRCSLRSHDFRCRAVRHMVAGDGAEVDTRVTGNLTTMPYVRRTTYGAVRELRDPPPIPLGRSSIARPGFRGSRPARSRPRAQA